MEEVLLRVMDEEQAKSQLPKAPNKTRTSGVSRSRRRNEGGKTTVSLSTTVVDPSATTEERSVVPRRSSSRILWQIQGSLTQRTHRQGLPVAHTLLLPAPSQEGRVFASMRRTEVSSERRLQVQPSSAPSRPQGRLQATLRQGRHFVSSSCGSGLSLEKGTSSTGSQHFSTGGAP